MSRRRENSLSGSGRVKVARIIAQRLRSPWGLSHYEAGKLARRLGLAPVKGGS
jgi:hypothetical protein